VKETLNKSKGIYYKRVMSCLCLLSKTETSCDEGPSSELPKVMKVFNRALLFDCVSRADPEALEGLLEYLHSHGKRLTDEEFKGEAPGVPMSEPPAGPRDRAGLRVGPAQLSVMMSSHNCRPKQKLMVSLRPSGSSPLLFSAQRM